VSLQARGIVPSKNSSTYATQTYNLQRLAEAFKRRRTCRNNFFCFWLPPSLFEISKKVYYHPHSLPKESTAI